MKFSDKTLKTCLVTTGGGMLGGYTDIRLARDGEEAVLEIRSRETHADREKTAVYRISADALDMMHRIAVDYDLYGASKRRPGKYIILDGDTTDIVFDYGKDSFRVSETQDLTERMSEGFWKAVEAMENIGKGEGTVTLEPQRAVLRLRSGYTLQFTVKDVFDGRLDGILGTEHDTAPYRDCGIVLCSGEAPDLTGAGTETEAGAGSIVYDPESGKTAVLYADCVFPSPVYVLAALTGHADSAVPLIREMTGPYRLYLD